MNWSMFDLVVMEGWKCVILSIILRMAWITGKWIKNNLFPELVRLIDSIINLTKILIELNKTLMELNKTLIDIR